jgi:hypothetical protein
LRAGSDLTLVGWGAMLAETLAAADTLAAEGVAAEVIDVATLKPLDADTIAASVTRTGRAVIVHEAALSGGFGAEIAARLAERCLFELRAPVLRVAGYDTVMPLAKLEQHYAPRGNASWRPRTGHTIHMSDTEFRLPDLGEGLRDAEIVQSTRGARDHVVADQQLVSVKPTRPWSRSAPHSGHIATLGAEGDRIAVGACW